MAKKWTFVTNDKEEAERVIRCGDAFLLLWIIQEEIIRGHFKHGKRRDATEVLERIRTEIYNSNLLDLWT